MSSSRDDADRPSTAAVVPAATAMPTEIQAPVRFQGPGWSAKLGGGSPPGGGGGGGSSGPPPRSGASVVSPGGGGLVSPPGGGVVSPPGGGGGGGDPPVAFSQIAMCASVS